MTKWELWTASHIPQTQAALERRQRRKSLTNCGTSTIPSEWKVRRAVRLAKSRLSLPPSLRPSLTPTHHLYEDERATINIRLGQPSCSPKKRNNNNPRPTLVSSSDALSVFSVTSCCLTVVQLIHLVSDFMAFVASFISERHQASGCLIFGYSGRVFIVLL